MKRIVHGKMYYTNTWHLYYTNTWHPVLYQHMAPRIIPTHAPHQIDVYTNSQDTALTCNETLSLLFKVAVNIGTLYYLMTV
jgi:hypothetical protein